MAGRLNGKVAIITGAAKGLGAADARLFVAEGATVILCDLDVEKGEALADELGVRALFVTHDVRYESAWIDLITMVEARFDQLNVLVNNAGVAEPGTPEHVNEADYRLVMAVSVDGVVFGCKHAIPAMRRAGGGSIINMASISAARGEPNQAAYSAAKGAVDAYTRTIAVYCAQTGLPIRCNAILPNGIVTPMVEALPGRIAERGVEMVTGVQSQSNERGQPNDVAHLVVYLASDESRWVSGQSILVDNSAAAAKGYVPPKRAVKGTECENFA